MTGLEWPMPTFADHSCFGPFLGHACAETVSRLIPSPRGPRHCGHSSAAMAVAATRARHAIAAGTVLLMGLDKGRLLWAMLPGRGLYARASDMTDTPRAAMIGPTHGHPAGHPHARWSPARGRRADLRRPMAAAVIRRQHARHVGRPSVRPPPPGVRPAHFPRAHPGQRGPEAPR